MLRQFVKKIDEKINVNLLLKILLILGILFLIQETDQVWGTWINTAKEIIKPFLFGFLIAYVLHPLVKTLNKHNVPKNIATLIVFVGLISFFVILFMVLIPILYDKILEFFNSLAYAVQWITDLITSYADTENIEIINEISKTATKFIREYQQWLPSITNAIPSLFNNAMSIVTTSLFSIIIGIYMLVDFDRMKLIIKRCVKLLFHEADPYLSEVNENVSIYIQSLCLLMLIKFVEYSFLYYLVGHNDWLVIGLLTAIGLIIPYFGASVANCIGILTALTLSPFRFICLIVGILVLANIDSYIIGPLVHRRRSSLGPLISLFAVFAGGIIANIVGIALAIPVVLAIRSIYWVYMRNLKHAAD